MFGLQQQFSLCCGFLNPLMIYCCFGVLNSHHTLDAPCLEKANVVHSSSWKTRGKNWSKASHQVPVMNVIC